MVSYYDTIVRYKGTFDYHGLYNLMKDFFTKRDYDWYETRYKDKGNEAEVEWTAERDYDEIHKIVFKISWHIWDFDVLEQEPLGKRKTIVRGRIDLRINQEHKEDYSGVYDDKDKIQRLMMAINKQLLSRDKDEYWDAIPLVLQHEFIAEVKKFLGMQSA